MDGERVFLVAARQPDCLSGGVGRTGEQENEVEETNSLDPRDEYVPTIFDELNGIL